MISSIFSRLAVLLFGTLYPAYASWKAIRTKDVREYVKWMMYWIVFALFTCFETFADVFLSWVPLYYEVKVVFVIWLLSPLTQGSSFLFRKFVHPHIAKREKDIDALISQTRETGYTTLLNLGTKGIRYASDIVVRTAVLGQSKIADHLRKSYSMNDLAGQTQPHPRYEGQTQPNPRYEDQTDSVMDSDEELDNRLREDNDELERRYHDDPDYTPPDKAKSYKKRSHTSPVLELSSVMEEDGDFEVIKEPPKVRVMNTRSSTRTRSNRYSSNDQALDTYAASPRQRPRKKTTSRKL